MSCIYLNQISINYTAIYTLSDLKNFTSVHFLLDMNNLSILSRTQCFWHNQQMATVHTNERQQELTLPSGLGQIYQDSYPQQYQLSLQISDIVSPGMLLPVEN